MKRKVKDHISNLSKKSEIKNLNFKSFPFSIEENLGEPKGYVGHSEDEIVGFSSDSEIESSLKGKANKKENVLSYNQQCYDSDISKIIWSEDSSSESEVNAGSSYPISNKINQPESHLKLAAVKNMELKRNMDQLNSTIESDISIDEFNEVISTEELDKTVVEDFNESKEIIKPLLSPIAGHSSDDKYWNAVKQPLHECSNEFKSSGDLIEDLTPSQSTKSIDLISIDACQQICDLDESMNEPVSVRKKKKVIKRGLVERLQKLVSREKSDLAFWKHDSVKRIDTECVLYLYVSSIKSACSLKIIFCQLFDSTEIFLIMPETTACYLKVKCGVTIKVSPPWRKIFCKDIGKVVLLCAYQINILPVNCPIFQSKAASDLIFFSNEQQLNFTTSNQIFDNYDVCIVPKTLLTENETCSITQAIKQNNDFVSFTARIQRVFKRVIPKIQHTSSAFVQQLSYQKETEICYTLFVQDKCGMVSEINLPSSIVTQNSMWKIAVVDGTNHVCKFENLIQSKLKTYKKNLSFISMLKSMSPDCGFEQLDSFCKNKTNKLLENNFLPFLHIFKINERLSTCHFLDSCDSFEKEYVPSFKVQCPLTTGVCLRGSVTLRLVSVTTSSFEQSIEEILNQECHFHGFCQVNSCNVLHVLRKLPVCLCPQTLVDAVSLKDPSQVHILSFTDVFIKDCLMTADMFTVISHSSELQDGFSKSLEPASSFLKKGDLFSAKATIIGLTEEFFCDVCFKCNDNELTKSEKGRWCVVCHSFTTTHSKMQLGVFLSIPELSYSSITCELREETSSTLLSTLRDKDIEGFDQNSLLGKSFGPKLVQVLDIVRTDDRGSLLLKEVIQLTT